MIVENGGKQEGKFTPPPLPIQSQKKLATMVAAATVSAIRKPTPSEEEASIRSRVLVDERKLRICMNKYWNFVNALKVGIPKDQARLKMYEFLIDMDHYELTMTRFELHQRMNEDEVQQYKEERKKLEQDIDTTQAEIKELRVRLDAVQKERQHKVEYDRETNLINKYPSRADSLNTIDTLQTDNASLRVEQEALAVTIENRKQQFQAAFTAIQSVREAIRSEKRRFDGTDMAEEEMAETEIENNARPSELRSRKRRLDDDDDEEEEEEGAVKEPEEEREAGEI